MPGVAEQVVHRGGWFACSAEVRKFSVPWQLSGAQKAARGSRVASRVYERSQDGGLVMQIREQGKRIQLDNLHARAEARAVKGCPVRADGLPR